MWFYSFCHSFFFACISSEFIFSTGMSRNTSDQLVRAVCDVCANSHNWSLHSQHSVSWEKKILFLPFWSWPQQRNYSKRDLLCLKLSKFIVLIISCQETNFQCYLTRQKGCVLQSEWLIHLFRLWKQDVNLSNINKYKQNIIWLSCRVASQNFISSKKYLLYM